MMNIHSMYYSMHKNEIFYALIYINNYVIISIVACYQETSYLSWIIFLKHLKGPPNFHLLTKFLHRFGMLDNPKPIFGF